ncbi:hypothetical protein FVE85_1817 [Porphyridium purpureum]|uniref:SGNH hydrolase-type esterase domain-containing protein n=1 Tax=Porphyridium purpureum TaxID=35688 RepID=A0A5J4YXT0_PORPP|nr:hypothetical protein FVE85_1817 [Porphyridium purpureum]|eukprot:POR6570..scf209_3
MEALNKLVATVYAVLVMPLYVVLMRWARYVSEDVGLAIWARQFQRDKVKTLLLVGDGVALGIGDSLVHGGLAGRMRRLMMHGRAREDYKLLLNWKIVSDAREFSTSEQWVPGSDKPADSQKTAASPKENKGNYFDEVFGAEGKYRDADVVVILVGSEDEKAGIAPKRSAENIMLTAKELTKLRKKVVVCTCALHSVDPIAEQHVAARNRELLERIKQVKPLKLGIFEGVDLMQIVNQGEMLNDIGGYIVFTDSAFRQLGSMLLDVVKDPMKQVEFQLWKNVLAAGPASSSSGDPTT